MNMNTILEAASALYVLLSLVGHMPFIPPKVAAFCNRVALNLKGLGNAGK